METKDGLLALIPRYQTGPHKGQATNERLREIDRLLHTYRYDEADMDILKKEILGATPQRVFDQRKRDSGY